MIRRYCECGRRLEIHTVFDDTCDPCVDRQASYEVQLSLVDSLDLFLYREVGA
jgi:hypothetical protein